MSFWMKRGLLGVALGFALVWPLAAAEVAREKSSDGETAGPNVTEVAPDAFTVPDGSAKEIMEYVKELESRVNSEIERLRGNLKQSSIEAADKILAGDPDQAEGTFAVQLKMKFLKPQERLALATELKAAGKDKLARIVLAVDWQYKLRMASMMGMKPNERRRLIEDVLKYLGEAPPEQSDVMLAQMVGRLAESLRDQSFTVKTYESLIKLLEEGKDPSAQALAKKLAGVVRRLTLVGNTVTIEGTLLNGEPLDMSKYRGKVVLIDFWATWCGPCVAEVPNMKKNYDLYHDKGFEILGISLDRSREPLDKFVKEKELPWAIVYGPGDARSPSVEYYGVMAIPTMFLVGKDGKVVSIEARGPKLDQMLEELLGPTEKKE